LGHVKGTGGDIAVSGAGVVTIGTGKVTLSKLDNLNSAGDGQALTYDATSGRLKWITLSSIALTGTTGNYTYMSGAGALATGRIVNNGAGIVEVPGQISDPKAALYVGNGSTSYSQAAIVAIAGTNPAVMAYNTHTTNAAIRAENFSSGPAIEAAGPLKGVTGAFTNGGTSRGVDIQNVFASNSAAALYATTLGTGQAGFFARNSPSAAVGVLEVQQQSTSNTSAVLKVIGGVASSPILMVTSPASFSGKFLQVQDSNAKNIMEIFGGGDTHHRIFDATTASTATPLTLSHNSTGAVTAGFAVQLNMQLRSSTTDNRDVAGIRVEWTTATDPSRAMKGRLFGVDFIGERAAFMWEATGAAIKTAVNGAAPVVRAAAIAALPAAGAAYNQAALNAIVNALNNALVAISQFGIIN
ncbi:MAG: hypothetical protein ABIR47_14390, partial [Candidatus Kapaibacterium sp.]